MHRAWPDSIASVSQHSGAEVKQLGSYCKARKCPEQGMVKQEHLIID